MANRMSVSRKRWHVTLIVTVFTLAVAGAAYTGWRFARESPPHQGPIVLISVDGLRADRLAVYGASAAPTPAIDALAAEGVVFERAYAHSPQTLPSHAALLTGQLPFENGVRDDGGYALGQKSRTIAEQLRNRGFSTGAAVSSFLLRRATGLARGFAFYDSDITPPTAEGAPLERDGLATFEVADRWLKMQTGQRYFLFIEVGADSADAVVERVVAELRRTKRYVDSTIILTSDHGDASSGISLDDTSLRVPLIVKQPGDAGGGRRVPQPVQHIDILPTVVDLVRAPMPSGLQGRSLRAILDKTSGFVPDRPIYAEFVAPRLRFDGFAVFALSSGPYRLVRGIDDQIQTLVADAPGPDAARAELLKTSLDTLANHAINAPSLPAPADEDPLAAFGYLPGLRTLTPAAPIVAEPEKAVPASAIEPPVVTRSMTAEGQLSLVKLHHDAAVLVGQRQYPAALERLRVLVAANQELPSIQYQMGLLLDRMGRFAESARALSVAATLRPEDPGLPVATAMTLLHARRVDEASLQADRAVELAEMTADPRWLAEAHDVAARVALARSDAAAAEKHALEAQKANPLLPLPQFVQGRVLYDNAQYEEALSALEGARSALKPETAPLQDLHLFLGNALARMDRYDDAEKEFEEELRLFPRSMGAYASLAMLYKASNRNQAVDEVIDELVAAAPTPEGYSTAVRLLAIVGQNARAESLRANARRRFRGDPSLVLLGRTR